MPVTFTCEGNSEWAQELCQRLSKGRDELLDSLMKEIYIFIKKRKRVWNALVNLSSYFFMDFVGAHWCGGRAGRFFAVPESASVGLEDFSFLAQSQWPSG